MESGVCGCRGVWGVGVCVSGNGFRNALVYGAAKKVK